MSKREKLLQKIRQNPKNVSFDELRTVLEQHGFILERTRGSHHTFSTVIDGEDVVLTIPFHRPLKVIYVKRAIELIDLKIVEESE